MKLVIITSIREDLQQVTKIFEQAAIPVFNVAETIGHKTEQHDFITSNWFGKKDAETQALFFFSFTDDDKAHQALQLVNAHNEQNTSGFPVRLIIVPVEQCSK